MNITYDIILSHTDKNFEKLLYSEPSDYTHIVWTELIKRAKDKGLNEIRFMRCDLFNKDADLLKDLGVYYELDGHGSTWWYRLFFTQELHENFLRRKQENFIESLCSFRQMGII